MQEDTTDVLKTIAGVLTLVILIFVLVISIGGYVGSKRCDRHLDNMNRDGHYTLLEGCLVETDEDIVVPLDNYHFEGADE